MISNKSLEELEELLNRYDETLFADGEYKSFQDGMRAIQNAYCKTFDKDRVVMIMTGVIEDDDEKELKHDDRKKNL